MAIVLWEAERLVAARAATDRKNGALTLTELIESAVGDDLKGLLGAIEKNRDRLENLLPRLKTPGPI